MVASEQKNIYRLNIIFYGNVLWATFESNTLTNKLSTIVEKNPINY